MSLLAIQSDALLSQLWDSGALNQCLDDAEWEDIMADIVIERCAASEKETE